MPDGFSFQDALKPADDDDKSRQRQSGFSFQDALKPQEQAKPQGDDLPWDVPMTGAQMRAQREAEKRVEALAPALKPDETITVPQLIGRIFARTFLQPAMRGGQSALGERPLPTGVEALGEAALGATPFRAGIPAEVPGAGPRPRVEPSTPAGPEAPPTPGPEVAPPAGPATPPGKPFSFEDAGITVDLGGVPIREAARPFQRDVERAPTPLREAGLPEPAVETETIAQPQADGTIRQVQVKTGEPPPPKAPPPPTDTGAPIGPDFRQQFPNLTDDQFEALFHQAAQEVPGGIPISPAATQSWLKRVAAVMQRIGQPAAAQAVPPKREPELTPESLAAERQKFAQATPAEPTKAATAQPEAPPEPKAVGTIEGYGGPWKPVLKDDGTPAKNRLGDIVYENPNGARAIMEGGVPWTERIKRTEQGMVPASPETRKPLHMVEGEEAPKPAEPKPAEKPAEKPAAEPKSEWTLLGKNEDGVEVYKNAQGVHSTLKDGIRSVEPVRLRPTKGGMEMSVPEASAKDPEFRVVTPAEKQKPAPEAEKAEKDRTKTDSEPAAETAKPRPAELPPSSGGVTEPSSKPRPAAASAPVAAPPEPRPGGRKPGSSLVPSIRDEKPQERGYDAALKHVQSLGGDQPLPSAGDLAKQFGIRPHEAGIAISNALTQRGPTAEATSGPVDTKQVEAGDLQAGDTIRTTAGQNLIVDKVTNNSDGTSSVIVQGDPRPRVIPTTTPVFIHAKPASGSSLVPSVRDAANDQAKPVKSATENFFGKPLPEEIAPADRLAGQVADAFRKGGSKAAAEVFNEGTKGWTLAGSVAASDKAKKAMREAGWQGGQDEPAPADDTNPTPPQVTLPDQDVPIRASPTPSSDELVTHVTKRGRTLTGTIRKDISESEAKSLDPASFRKNNGWFIRSKPTKSEPKAEPVQTPAEAATQAGDVAPPDPPPEKPADPAVAEAADLAQGKGPEPVQAIPEPRGVYKARREHALTDDEQIAGVTLVDDPLPEEADEVDRIVDMISKGWSPVDISEAPGITKTEREIRAVKDYLDGPEPPEWWTPRESSSGIQDPLRFGDEGDGPEGVQRTEPVGETGGAPSGDVSEGAPDAEGPAGGQTTRSPRTGKPGGRGGSRGSRKGNPDRLPDAGEGSEPGAAGRPDPEQVVSESKGQDFTIEPGDLGEDRGRMQKARDNVKAIELAKRLTAEKRLATVEQQRDLVKYVGWGGLKNAFRDGKGNFGQGMERIGAQIESLLTPEELRTAARSVQYAHYTAEHVIRSMWDAVQRLGFTGGSVFEPGMGIGHFRGLMPPDLAEKSAYRGIEMDHLTADIAKLLYPNSGVAQVDFTRMALPEDAFDLVIGNPPFARGAITSDPKYAANRFDLHDYFFAKSLDAVRPGGLLAFVTSAGTMNKMGTEAREYLAQRGQFIGGVRLPSSAFRQNAMTDVTTDILFFKRRPEGKRDLADIPDEEKTWIETAPVTLPDDEGNQLEGVSNRWFNEHPEVVLGEEGFWDKLYEDRYAIRQRPGTDLPSDLRIALSRLPEGVMDPPPTQREAWERDFDAPETKNGSYYVDKDGTLMQYANGAGRPVQKRGKTGGGMPAADYARVVKLVPVRNALRNVFKADLAEDAAAAKAARAELNDSYDAFVKEFGPINKAEISTRRPTVIQQETARREAREEARYVGDRWDEGDFDSEPFYERKAKTAEIAAARQAAREAAILAGKPFNEGSFDPDDMPDTVIDKRPNIKPFMEDPESYRLRSIEDYNDATGEASKREIFYRNPISKYTEPELKSANDGLLWSLNSLGRFDAAAIAEKMGKTEDQIISDLGDLVFEPPETPGVWQTRDEYLSGDVKTKLAQAQEAARKNPRYQRNVDALEGAQPVPLGPGQITLVVGMPWIPMDVIKEFVRDGLELGAPVIQYSPAISRWSVEPSTNRWRTDTAAGLPKWSTPRRTAYELLQDALNRTQPRVYDTVSSGDSTTQVLNEKDTLAAQEKVAEIQRAFFDPDLRSGWAISEPKRAKVVTDAYNDALNREVLRQFNGDYLTTPGITGSWRWRPHQTRVINRIIMQGNTYMAHAVGAGKTSAMIGAGMEMKRLGLVKKPMYVVPNHMLGQFTKEFYEQYPAARIAVADDEQFHTDRRRQFMANVAADDLDAVIITHSSFKKVPVSDDFSRQAIQDEIDELTDAMKEAEGDRFTVRRLESMKERLEQKLSKPATDKDQTLNFEDMGVDFLFVDEAHGYRKLPFVTLQGNVKGIDPNGSDLARDLHMKVRYLETQRPGRSLVMASGTPVTNTMGELFSIGRFLQPNAMSARGVATFDAWAQTFANTKTALEQNPDGSYKAQTRLSQFVNMPELYKMVGSVMDIVTSEQLGQYVTRPKLKDGERIFNQVDPTPEQVAYAAELGRRLEAIKNRTGPPQKGDDIILTVINDGRHAAIDPRFVSQAQGNTKSKLNKMLDNVVQIWKDSADTQFMDPASNYEKPSFRGPATQMIFANLGINSKNGFSTYDWIKEYLRRAGVPANEVAFIKDYKTSVAKQGLFNDMNEGKVRILIGSTQKMGTGINAQRRLLAVHNLDPVWFPADDEQRNGRILRQGNHNPEIQIHDYATNGSYDSTMWQMMGRKAGFIEQFFRGDPNLRDMEDLGEASMYEQASAMTTSDPRVMQLTQLRMDLKRLILRREGFRSNQWTLQNKLEGHQRSAVWYDKRIAAAEQDIAQRQDITGKKFSAVVDGETYTDRAEFNKAIDAAADKYAAGMKEAVTKKIGAIGGFPVSLFKGRSTAKPQIEFNGDRVKDLEGNYTLSAQAHMRNLETDRENYEANAEKERAAAAAIEPLLGAQFTEGAEIARLDKAVKDLEAELKGRPTDAEKNATAEEEGSTTLVNQVGGGIDLDEPREVKPPRLTGRVVDLPDDLEPD